MARPTVSERFWAKVAKAGPDECWLWKATLGNHGYGVLSVRHGETETSHRLAWSFTNGPIPDGAFVLHKCDVRACCNPRHLALGTQADNIGHMWSRGRQQKYPKGETHHCAKLTWEIVAEIKAATGSNRKVAAMFGIGRQTVQDIRAGKRWQNG